MIERCDCVGFLLRYVRNAAMLMLFVVGCSSVTVPPDASAGDAPVVRPPCGAWVNAVGVPAFACPWQTWSCQETMPAYDAVVACAEEVAPDADCATVQAHVEACARR